MMLGKAKAAAKHLGDMFESDYAKCFPKLVATMANLRNQSLHELTIDLARIFYSTIRICYSMLVDPLGERYS